jgi:ribonuclease Z
MEKITINFLGTGTAVPTKKRNHTAILASFDNENILFDCGEGIQRQFRIASLNPCKLTRVFITHWHGDHFFGLPGLFETLAMSNYSKTLKLYGPRGTKKFIELIRQMLHDIEIKIEVHEIEEGIIINEKKFKIEAAAMTHGPPALAYSLTLKEKTRINKSKLKKLKIPNSPLIKDLVAGKDILINNKKIKSSSIVYKEPEKKIAIILDTSINPNCEKIAKNSDILIAEASFTKEEMEKAKEYKHLTAEDSAKIAKITKSKKLILTHISQRFEHNTKPIEKEAKKVFKNTSLANDFDKIVI